MNNDRLVLADSTQITLESSLGISTLNVRVENIDAACTLWKKFTPENLKEITVQNAAGETTGRYPDMVLDHITGAGNTGGTVLVTFCLRSKTTEEILEERIAALEAGQQTQDEAIGDLGQAVSDMAEGGVQ